MKDYKELYETLVCEINAMVQGRKWEIEHGHDYEPAGITQAEIKVLTMALKRAEELEKDGI